MTRPLLPPRGIFVGTSILFAPDISPPARDTLLQLMALAWGSDTHLTPPLSYALLEHLTGKKARTLRGHLASLRSYRDVLRLQPAGEGQFIILFSEWLFGRPGGASAAHIPLAASGRLLPPPDDHHDHKEEEESNSEFVELHPPPDHPAPPAQKSASRLQRGNAGAPALPPKLQASLGEAGIFTSLFPEIGRIAREQGWSAKDLLALLAWCQEDSPDRPGGLFVARLRREFRPPPKYYQPACPRCARRGKHEPGCPRSYALDDSGP